MVEKAATIWADGPSSAPDQPSKPLIREWGTWLEGFISAIGENSGTIFETKAQMDAALAYDANTMAWVVDDADVANNGVYRKIGASGSGSWARVADLPYSYVTVVDDGTSTANAMSMETTLPVGFGSMIAIKVPLTNTSSTVTISFNGSTAIPVKTASGGLPPVGTLIQNMVCLGFVNDVDNVFQLMTDVASAAIQTAAAASASAASTSATNAATSATLAQGWATKAEDVPVTGSLYSAYHWAQKAMAYATGSIAAAIHGATSKSAPTALDEFAIADSDASWGLKKVTAESVMSGPQGYIYGLAMTNNTTDATNDIDFAAGVATSDVSPFFRMTLSALTKRIDAAWSVGTNQGGLDTGTVGDETYYIWAIQRSDTSVTDVLFSLSNTSPTMPSSYDRKRLIGSLVRSGGVNGVPRQHDYYVSDEISIVTSSVTTLTHGLGAEPKYVNAFLICKTAELGYAVGTKVLMSPRAGYVGSGAQDGIQLSKADATTISVSFANQLPYIIPRTGGSPSYITAANWKLIVEARK